jgi:large subunit ribosomal protein L29
MRPDQIRELSLEEMARQLDEGYRELMSLRFRAKTRRLKNIREIRKVKRNIARIKTIMREKELGIS